MNQPKNERRYGSPHGRASGERSGVSLGKYKPSFELAKPDVELVDELAEKEAKSFGKLNKNQLRKFFGEVKDMYRRLEQRHDADKNSESKFFAETIAPQFKMLRSKAAYGRRSGGHQEISEQFFDFIDNGTKAVNTADDFRRFVKHFEAIVGFYYGQA